MKKTDILARLCELNFDTDHYWLITGAAMVLYDIREETGDIDMGCTSFLADQLERLGYETIPMPDGTRKIAIDSDVEIFENWLYDTVQMQDGFPVISLNGLMEMKRSLGREKDLYDIHLIEAFLAENHR